MDRQRRQTRGSVQAMVAVERNLKGSRSSRVPCAFILRPKLDAELGATPMSALGVVANGAIRLVVVPPRHRAILLPCLAQNPLKRQRLVSSLPR